MKLLIYDILEIDGKTIRVDYSITRREHTPTPGGDKWFSEERHRKSFKKKEKRFIVRIFI